MIIAVSTHTPLERTASLDGVMGASTVVSLDNLRQTVGGRGAAVAGYLSRSGADVLFVSAAPQGSGVAGLLDGDGIPHHLVPVDRPAATSFSVSAQTGPVNSVSRGFQPAPGEAAAVAGAVAEKLSPGDIVYLSGPDVVAKAGGGLADDGFYRLIVRTVRQQCADVTVVVDSREHTVLWQTCWPLDCRPDWLVGTDQQTIVADAVRVEYEATGPGASHEKAVADVTERLALSGRQAAGIVIVLPAGRAVVASPSQQITADLAKNTGKPSADDDETVARLLAWADK